ncbi:MAG: response regulator [Candidatus Omnitrophica bacterium]|nr:response regulator [Candidatus Omnitrophota bacterium]
MVQEPLKILIVEDEEDILIETKDIFEKKGFVAFTAIDSSEALEIFQKERPRVCLLDVHMPKSKLDGIGILEQIRLVDKSCICIMLTRLTDKDKVDAARRLGANHYVLKPLDYHELLKLIDDTVKNL